VSLQILKGHTTSSQVWRSLLQEDAKMKTCWHKTQLMPQTEVLQLDNRDQLMPLLGLSREEISSNFQLKDIHLKMRCSPLIQQPNSKTYSCLITLSRQLLELAWPQSRTLPLLQEVVKASRNLRASRQEQAQLQRLEEVSPTANLNSFWLPQPRAQGKTSLIWFRRERFQALTSSESLITNKWLSDYVHYNCCYLLHYSCIT
jgi:hypothetical protein